VERLLRLLAGQGVGQDLRDQLQPRVQFSGSVPI
jgi:hypothetical protein